MLVLLPLMVVYLFLAGIIARPESAFALVPSSFPLTAPVGMIARMAASDVPIWQPVLAALLQLLTVLLIVRSVSRLFQAQTLLSGQPLSARRFVMAVLGRA
jgi:ABC-2 type transport system permease protein